MAGYDGLALSMYDKNVLSFTNDGAHNFFSIVVADSTTVTSGYIQPLYVSLTQSGGSSDQINAFAADIALGGTCSGEISGMYLYFSETGTAAGFSTFNGVAVNMTAFAWATAPTVRAGFHAYSAEPTATNASLMDAAFLCSNSDSTGTWGAAIGVDGVTAPEYFLWIKDAPGEERFISTQIVANIAAATTWLKVRLQATNFWIALHASCTS